MAAGSTLSRCFTLRNGSQIPALGIGTFATTYAEVSRTMNAAIEQGYRHFDTSSIMGVETVIGTKVSSSGIDRSDFFLSTKLWNSKHIHSEKRIVKALRALHTSYIDLFYIQYPYTTWKSGVKIPDDVWNFYDTWKRMHKLVEAGQCKGLGIANFSLPQLKAFVEYCEKNDLTVPAVHQCEIHPLCSQKAIVDYCKSKSIHVAGYNVLGSSMMKAALDPKIQQVMKKYERSAPQIVVAWALQQGISYLPKLTSANRIKEIANIDFELENHDMELIDSISAEAGDKPDVRPYWLDSDEVIEGPAADDDVELIDRSAEFIFGHNKTSPLANVQWQWNFY
ncbi:NADP-dependent oxidoreductase domain-containing protein [Kockiozyma suomiensis]|uniref:NADP-dependent oxidoreductase domain-containing protein n=1 Tax=Kockiozyma suomiensis TaxID=1337062 RepID=UPI0033439BE0